MNLDALYITIGLTAMWHTCPWPGRPGTCYLECGETTWKVGAPIQRVRLRRWRRVVVHPWASPRDTRNALVPERTHDECRRLFLRRLVKPMGRPGREHAANLARYPFLAVFYDDLLERGILTPSGLPASSPIPLFESPGPEDPEWPPEHLARVREALAEAERHRHSRNPQAFDDFYAADVQPFDEDLE